MPSRSAFIQTHVVSFSGSVGNGCIQDTLLVNVQWMIYLSEKSHFCFGVLCYDLKTCLFWKSKTTNYIFKNKRNRLLDFLFEVTRKKHEIMTGI